MRPGNNHYPTVGVVSYTNNNNNNNNNGCLTGDGVWTFGYDVLNRFISAVKSGVSASYLYDPMDRQSQKNVGGTKTRFIYNGLQRIAEYDGTLNTRFVYATGLDEPIVEVSSGGTKTFFHRDRLGSIIARTNNSGAVTQRYEYGPYGESAALTGTSFGYTGQRYDAESGLYNYKARYYSPTIGRFLQPDVIGYADGLNLYAYVGNQPTNFVDPAGLASDGGTLGDFTLGGIGLEVDSATGELSIDGQLIAKEPDNPTAFDKETMSTQELEKRTMEDISARAKDVIRGTLDLLAPDPHDINTPYTIKEGDTLWDIAKDQLKDATRWTQLYDWNKGMGAKGLGNDPNLITPGTQILIPGKFIKR